MYLLILQQHHSCCLKRQPSWPQSSCLLVFHNNSVNLSQPLFPLLRLLIPVLYSRAKQQKICPAFVLHYKEVEPRTPILIRPTSKLPFREDKINLRVLSKVQITANIQSLTYRGQSQLNKTTRWRSSRVGRIGISKSGRSADTSG